MAVVVTAGALAEDNPAPEVPRQLRSTLARLEKQTWEALKQRDATTIKKLWADDFVGVLGSGLRRTKAEILQTLSDLAITSYELEDVRVVPLGNDAAILTYRLTRKSSFQGKELPGKNLVASAWVNRAGNWRIVFYQETPAAR